MAKLLLEKSAQFAFVRKTRTYNVDEIDPWGPAKDTSHKWEALQDG